MSALDITDTDMDEYISRHQTIVIDCWASWCAPCLMMHHIIEELSEEMQGKVVFGKLNIDENRTATMKYQIMSIPTLLVFKNGVLVDKLIGVMPKEMLKAKLEVYN